MDEFRTTVRVKPSPHLIGLKNKVLTMGSCFADAIGDRLNRFKFQSLVNPFGVIYNPVSIHKALRYAIHQELPPDHTYLQHQQVNLNYDFHSELSALQKSTLKENISNRIGTTHYFLKDTHWLLITYGTAWIYSRNDTGEIVANCHKMTPTTFSKSLLRENEIIDSFETLYNELMIVNPSLHIILTLSPVRHIKDTLELNSVSKSLLRVVCHYLTERFERVEYFPAYEMMLDDLRDYRFYKSDMLHPSEDAAEYIWQNFALRYFSDETKTFIKQWKSFLAAMSHKPFHPDSTAHQDFLKDTLRKLEQLKPVVNVDEEVLQIKSQLK